MDGGAECAKKESEKTKSGDREQNEVLPGA